MALRREAFLDRVKERGEYDSRQEAERAARVVLALLGAHLVGEVRAQLAARLPEDFALIPCPSGAGALVTVTRGGVQRPHGTRAAGAGPQIPVPPSWPSIEALVRPGPRLRALGRGGAGAGVDVTSCRAAAAWERGARTARSATRPGMTADKDRPLLIRPARYETAVRLPPQGEFQHAELDRERTWSNDTTHAIHESQTLRIERIHEAHPRETSSSPGARRRRRTSGSSSCTACCLTTPTTACRTRRRRRREPRAGSEISATLCSGSTSVLTGLRSIRLGRSVRKTPMCRRPSDGYRRFRPRGPRRPARPPPGAPSRYPPASGWPGHAAAQILRQAGARSRAISQGRPGSATRTNRRFLPFVSASGCLMHSRPAAGWVSVMSRLAAPPRLPPQGGIRSSTRSAARRACGPGRP